MVRKIEFYKTKDGECSVAKFIDSQPTKVAVKITWVLKLIQETAVVPKTYFKKLAGTEFYECRIGAYGNSYRLLGFFDIR